MKAAKPKIKIDCTIRLRTGAIILRAIDDGVCYGWHRAHKHTDTPDDEMIKSAIDLGVGNEISEWINFDPPEGAPPPREDAYYIMSHQVRRAIEKAWDELLGDGEQDDGMIVCAKMVERIYDALRERVVLPPREID